MCRPGSVIGAQQDFLEKLVPLLKTIMVGKSVKDKIRLL
jgi:hypothetical protein